MHWMRLSNSKCMDKNAQSGRDELNMHSKLVNNSCNIRLPNQVSFMGICITQFEAFSFQCIISLRRAEYAL
jgi:hypothetical protein